MGITVSQGLWIKWDSSYLLRIECGKLHDNQYILICVAGNNSVLWQNNDGAHACCVHMCAAVCVCVFVGVTVDSILV